MPDTALFNRATAPLYDLLAWPFVQAATKAAIEELGDLPPGARVLEVGVGTGLALAALTAALPIQADGVDQSPGMLEIAAARVPAARLFQGQAESLPFQDGQYAALLYSYVFRHIQPSGVDQVLSEASRVLAPGGRAIVTDFWLPLTGAGLTLAANIKILGVWSLHNPATLAEQAQAFGLSAQRIQHPPFSFTLVLRKTG